MSYKTPLKPVTHGVLKKFDFLDNAQNEAVNERDNSKIYVEKVSMSPFLYFCFLLQIPVCVSIFFYRKFSVTAAVSYVFFWHFAREIGAWNWRVKLARDWPKFDPLAHAFRLTAVVIEGLFASITILWSTHPNACKCLQFIQIQDYSFSAKQKVAKFTQILTDRQPNKDTHKDTRIYILWQR